MGPVVGRAKEVGREVHMVEVGVTVYMGEDMQWKSSDGEHGLHGFLVPAGGCRCAGCSTVHRS